MRAKSSYAHYVNNYSEPLGQGEKRGEGKEAWTEKNLKYE